MRKEPSNLISEIVECVGGPRAAATLCDLKSYQAVRKWERYGLPRTEFSGETKYSEILVDVANRKLEENKTPYTKQQLLDASTELRQARSA